MSTYQPEDSRKVTTHRLREMKERGEKIAMLTAYDYTMATLVDSAGMDVILQHYGGQHHHPAHYS